MTKCDLCSDETALLYTVENPKNQDKEKHQLCEECLKIVHETYVRIK